tara:strand:- start:1238 stop:2059 length:822 start_codon:yes stop_codon:yes gene_type:complete
VTGTTPPSAPAFSTVTANGLRINYKLDGPEDGPVVMLSNSLLSNLTMWDDQTAALTGAGFRVLRHDTRGHGGTAAPDVPYSIRMFADDAAALLAALDIARVHFVGLSMGGFIAQLMAVHHPGKIASLCLCDTACVMPPADLWNDRIRTATQSGVAALVRGTLQRWFTEPFHGAHPEAIARVRAMIEASPLVGYLRCAAAIRDMDQYALLGQITVPTRIIVGEEDPACPVAAARVLHSGIAGSELVIIPDAAHLPNIEKADAFNAALLGFLTRQ